MTMAELVSSGTGTQEYLCDICDQWFTEDDYTSREVWYIADGLIDHLDGDCCREYIEVNSHAVEDAWWCGDDCFHHDQGDSPHHESYGGQTRESGFEVWECGACGQQYDSSECLDEHGGDVAVSIACVKDQAIQCCKEDEDG